VKEVERREERKWGKRRKEIEEKPRILLLLV
jgi:hypothetical protein